MPTVLIGGLPAARVTDVATCVGPPDMVAQGSSTVFIGGLPAARLGDPCAHGGKIVGGCATVLIGDNGAGSGPAPGAALSAAAAGVNPTNSVLNCGHIVDAVVARLRHTNPNATAPAGQDGSFTQIEQRLGTHMIWNKSLSAAFSAVDQGGNGTIAVVGIQYSGGAASHVVIIANDHGQTGVVEGQNWGPGQGAGVITDPAAANARYSPDGKSNIGYGILPPPALNGH